MLSFDVYYEIGEIMSIYDKTIQFFDTVVADESENLIITCHVLKNYIDRDLFNLEVQKAMEESGHEHLHNNDAFFEDVYDIVYKTLGKPSEDTFGIDHEWLINQINYDIKTKKLDIDTSLFGRRFRCLSTSYDSDVGEHRGFFFGTVISYLLNYIPEEITAPFKEIEEVKNAVNILKQHEISVDEKNIKLFLSSKNLDEYALKKELKNIFSSGFHEHVKAFDYLKDRAGYRCILDEVQNVVPPIDDKKQLTVQELTTVVFINEKDYNYLHLSNIRNFRQMISKCDKDYDIINVTAFDGYRRIMYLNESIGNVALITELHDILSNL